MKNFPSKRKKKIDGLITLYIKRTKSNIFVSLYKDSSVDKVEKCIHFNNTIKILSCGQFQSVGEKKSSLTTATSLGIQSALYALKHGYKHVNLIINGVKAFKRVLIRNILLTKYKGNTLKLLALLDLSYYPYGNYKVKKDKKR